MNQDNQENNPDALPNFSSKRKRGRPRKHPRPNLNHGENAVRRDHNLNHGQNVTIPPGFEAMNGNQPRANPLNDANDVVVGQAVYGVIEAAFDAGYLLTVKVGDSETTMRGVVFKPGHYVPVSAEIDVAPNVQMVRRNEIPFPAENHTQSRERNNQHANSFRNGTANLGVPKVKQDQDSHPVISRSNMVPAILPPVNLSNGRAVANQTARLESSIAKQALETAHTVNGSRPTNQVPTVGNQVLPSQRQTGHQGVLIHPPAELRDEEAKPMTLPGSHVSSYRNGITTSEFSISKQVPPVAAQTAHPVIPRNKMVPVILQPVNLSNGGSVANQQSPDATHAARLEASKAKRVLEAAHTVNGSTPTNQVLTIGNQVLPSQPQTGHQGVLNQRPAELHDEEANTKNLPGLPFENLLTEVPSQTAEPQTENRKDDTGYLDPLSSYPRQAMQPDLNCHPASLPKPFENFRTGKMTELLRAVQENMLENQAPSTT